MAQTELHKYTVQEKLNKMDIDLIDVTVTPDSAAHIAGDIISEPVEITPPDKTESQTVDLKGKFKAIRKDKKPLKATWF